MTCLMALWLLWLILRGGLRHVATVYVGYALLGGGSGE